MKKLKMLIFAVSLSFAFFSCADNDATREPELNSSSTSQNDIDIEDTDDNEEETDPLFEEYTLLTADFDELTTEDLLEIDFDTPTWSGKYYKSFIGDTEHYISKKYLTEDDIKTINNDVVSDKYYYQVVAGFFNSSHNENFDEYHCDEIITKIKGNADRTKLFFYEIHTYYEIGTGAHKMVRTEFHFITKD